MRIRVTKFYKRKKRVVMDMEISLLVILTQMHAIEPPFEIKVTLSNGNFETEKISK